MTIHSFVLPYIIPSNYINSSPYAPTPDAAGRRTAAQFFVTKIRDLFRNGDGLGYGFNAGLPSPWIVSDIARLTQSNFDYYIFEIKNTTLNKSWAFVFFGSDQSSDGASRGDQVQPGGSNQGFNYMQSISASPTTGNYGSLAPFSAVWYNPDTITDDFDMAFNGAAPLTYTGGDFSTPGTANLPWNTAAKMNAWLPSHGKSLRGACIQAGGTSSNQSIDMMINIDDNASDTNMGIFVSEGGDRDLSSYANIGDNLTSVTPGDTYLNGLIWGWYSTSATSYGVPVFGEGYVDARTSAGVATSNYNLVPQKTLTLLNQKDGSGDFIWYRIGVVVGANNKGFVKDTILREIGGLNIAQVYRQRFAAPSGADCMIKFASTYAIRYPPSVATFPFTFPERI